MSFQAESYIPSTPNYDVIVGKFCYPYPIAPGGVIQPVANKPRPLVIGTDITVAEVSGDFQIDSLTDSFFLEYGVNPGDQVVFNTPAVGGVYTVKSVTNGGQIFVSGPGKDIASGSIFFAAMPQPIFGVGTDFRKAKRGDYLVVMSDTLTPTVQVAKIAEVTDATHMKVHGGFIGDITDLPLILCTGKLLGVSVNCGGAGIVNGKAVAADDVITFYQSTGLDPVYGDSGANTFKILIQK